jgi:hypothetical protein
MIEGVCRRVALLAAGAAAALFMLGCGGGEDEDTTASAPPATVAEFVERGNEVCTASNEEIETGLRSFAEERGLSGNDQPTAKQVEELATEVMVPAIAGQVEEMRAIGVPSEGGKQVDRFLDNAEAAVREVEADPTKINRLAGGVLAKVNAEAVALGLVSCGKEI